MTISAQESNDKHASHDRIRHDNQHRSNTDEITPILAMELQHQGKILHREYAKYLEFSFRGVYWGHHKNESENGKEDKVNYEKKSTIVKEYL